MNIAYTSEAETIQSNKNYNSIYIQYLNDYKRSGLTNHIL